MTEQPSPLELNYESAAPIGRRPRWVWVVIGTYLLILLGGPLVTYYALGLSDSSDDLMIPGSIAATVLGVCGLGLVFTPVRISRRRPITRRSIWIPLITSGFLIGLLVVGAGYALAEGFRMENDATWLGVMIGGGVVWIGWTVVLWLMTSRRAPEWIAVRLHRAVIAGSVAELLVAVPTHIVVRRRHECCGGWMTGSAIAVGCVVMLLSLGPSVVFLYYRRWQQTTGERPRLSQTPNR